MIEDRLEIYNLLASHPLSADTGDRSIIESIYTKDVVFDRGDELPGANGKDNMASFVDSDAHRTAIAGGLAHIGTPAYVEATTPWPSPISPSRPPTTMASPANWLITAHQPASASIASSPTGGPCNGPNTGGPSPRERRCPSTGAPKQWTSFAT
jgi:hypothetical protein